MKKAKMVAFAMCLAWCVAALPVIAGEKETGIGKPFEGLIEGMQRNSVPNYKPQPEQYLDKGNVFLLHDYNGLKPEAEFRSASWKPANSSRDHFYKYKVVRIVQYTGAYDNILGNWFQKEVLVSGAVESEVNEVRTYKQTSTMTLSFNWSIGFEEARSVAAMVGLSGVDVGASISVKTGLTFTLGNSYTWASSALAERKLTVRLGKEQAEKYCPDGLEMSIGHYGTFVCIDVMRSEWIKHLFYEEQVAGVKETESSIVVSDEASLTLGFIYRRNPSLTHPNC